MTSVSAEPHNNAVFDHTGIDKDRRCYVRNSTDCNDIKGIFGSIVIGKIRHEVCRVRLNGSLFVGQIFFASVVDLTVKVFHTHKAKQLYDLVIAFVHTVSI